MERPWIWAGIVGIAFLLGQPWSAQAFRGGGFGHGGFAGHAMAGPGRSGFGGFHGGFHGPGRFAPRGPGHFFPHRAFEFRGERRFESHRPFFFHRREFFFRHEFFPHRFRRHAEVETLFFFGPDFWWGPDWWWWGPPYVAAPVVVPEAPTTYIQREQPSYWYYCPNPAGYYPYIQACPPGWLTVVPSAGAAGTGAPEPQAGIFASGGPVITRILSHAQELELTTDQIQKLQQLRTTFEKEAVARASTIRTAEADLDALLAKDQWDLPAIEAKVKQLAALHGDLGVARIQTLAAARALLTSAQVQKLKAMALWTPPQQQ